MDIVPAIVTDMRIRRRTHSKSYWTHHHRSLKAPHGRSYFVSNNFPNSQSNLVPYDLCSNRNTYRFSHSQPNWNPYQSTNFDSHRRAHKHTHGNPDTISNWQSHHILSHPRSHGPVLGSRFWLLEWRRMLQRALS